MALAFRWLTADFATAGQLTTRDMSEAVAAGFRSVINNRPDFEGGPSQPASAAMQQAAEAAQLRYVFLPVASAHQTPEQIAQMRQALDELPKPILGFCRSGARTANIFHAAKALPKA